jgi:hypothetical protein
MKRGRSFPEMQRVAVGRTGWHAFGFINFPVSAVKSKAA